MNKRAWRMGRDGEFSESALRETIEGLGYSLETVRYPAGVWVPPHTYASDTVQAVVSGSVTVSRDGEEYPLQPGDAVEIGAGEQSELATPGDSHAVVLHGVRPVNEDGSLHPVRLGILALLIAGINGWCVLHLGFEPANLVIPSTLIALLPVLIGLAGRTSGALSDSLAGRWLDRLASTPAALVLATVFFLLGTFSSSLSIRATDLDRPLNVRVTPVRPLGLDPVGKGWLEPDETIRFWRLTVPPERKFQVEVDGYLPETVEIAPWWPKVLVVERDMDRVVTLVVRMGYELTAGFGTLSIQVTPPDGEPGDVKTFTCDGDCWAFVIGPGEEEVPSQYFEVWRSELRNEAESGASDGSDLAWTWTKPEPLDVPGIVPRATMKMTFHNENEELLSCEAYSVTTQPFQELRLRKTEETRTVECET